MKREKPPSPSDSIESPKAQVRCSPRRFTSCGKTAIWTKTVRAAACGGRVGVGVGNSVGEGWEEGQVEVRRGRGGSVAVPAAPAARQRRQTAVPEDGRVVRVVKVVRAG